MYREEAEKKGEGKRGQCARDEVEGRKPWWKLGLT